MPSLTKNAYAAVRLTEGKEWIDTSTLDLLPEETRRKAGEVERACGTGWARVNPVVRFVAVALVEGETLEVTKVGEREARRK